MPLGSVLIGAIGLFAAGFAVSLLVGFRRGRSSLAPVGIGLAMGALAVVVTLWAATAGGWKVFSITAAVMIPILAVVFFLWLAASFAVETWRRMRWFRRHRATLETLAREPESDVSDPALRAGGVYSFERSEGRVYFCADESNDNGRTPSVLSGFVHAPDGPPSIGAVLPRSTGRHAIGAPAFKLVSVRPLGGGWWDYSAEEVWPERT